MSSSSSVNRIYIGNLPTEVSDRDIRRAFSQCGNIVDITIKKFYAFLDFERRSEMKNAIDRFNKKEFLRNIITVEPAKGIKRDGGYPPSSSYSSRGGGRSPPPYGRSSGGYSSNYRSGPMSGRPARIENKKLAYRVLVLNVPKDAQWNQLKDHMKQAGEVNYVSCNDVVTKVGIVEFNRSKDIKKCVEMFHKTTFMGKTIHVIDPESFAKQVRNSRSSVDPNDNIDNQHGESYHSVEEFSKSQSHSLSPFRNNSQRYSKSHSPASRSPYRSQSRSPASEEEQDHASQHNEKENRVDNYSNSSVHSQSPSKLSPSHVTHQNGGINDSHAAHEAPNKLSKVEDKDDDDDVAAAAAFAE